MPPLLPEWAPNIHPLIVHFPIAWWIGAVVVDLVFLTAPKAAWADTTASVLYPAGAVAAGVAYVAGREAAATVFMPGMAHAIMVEHWNWALATTMTFAGLAVVRLWVRFGYRQAPRGLRIAIAAIALAGLAALFETAERGARLVFEQGVGVAAPSVDLKTEPNRGHSVE